MTPAEAKAQFIALWIQGLEIAVMAERLGIPKGTVQSRAHRLQQRRLIQSRPRGGWYPRQKAQSRHAPPIHPSVQSSAGQPLTALVPSPAVASTAIIDLLRQTLARLDTVEQDLKAIWEDRQPGAGQSSAVQSGAETPALPRDEARAERWNLWLPRGLGQRIEAVAKARGHAPSKVVQEALWQWLAAADT